jgi:hypothetical protein
MELPDWTEEDTNDIMDLMETVLNIVKTKLLSEQEQKTEEVPFDEKKELEVERLVAL